MHVAMMPLDDFQQSFAPNRSLGRQAVPKLDVTLGRARPIGHSPADMAADHFSNDRNSARIGNSLVPTAQEAKAQATKIYEALDAKGYGIVKRQHAADALADSKVRSLADVCRCSQDLNFVVTAVYKSGHRRATDHQSAAPGHRGNSQQNIVHQGTGLCLSLPCTFVVHLCLPMQCCFWCVAGVCSVLQVSQCQHSCSQQWSCL